MTEAYLLVKPEGALLSNAEARLGPVLEPLEVLQDKLSAALVSVNNGRRLSGCARGHGCLTEGCGHEAYRCLGVVSRKLSRHRELYLRPGRKLPQFSRCRRHASFRQKGFRNFGLWFWLVTVLANLAGIRSTSLVIAASLLTMFFASSSHLITITILFSLQSLSERSFEIHTPTSVAN